MKNILNINDLNIANLQASNVESEMIKTEIPILKTTLHTVNQSTVYIWTASDILKGHSVRLTGAPSGNISDTLPSPIEFINAGLKKGDTFSWMIDIINASSANTYFLGANTAASFKTNTTGTGAGIIAHNIYRFLITNDQGTNSSYWVYRISASTLTSSANYTY